MCFKKKSYLWGELIKRHLFSLDKEMVVGLVHLLFCCLTEQYSRILSTKQLTLNHRSLNK